MRIGMTELIVIFVVALFVVGPERLPMYAKKLGEALAQFKKYSDEATKDIKESIVEPLEEAQRPLKEAVEPFTELDKAVRDNVKDVQDSFNNIGKPKKANPAKKEEKPEIEEKPEPEEKTETEEKPEPVETEAAESAQEEPLQAEEPGTAVTETAKIEAETENNDQMEDEQS